MLVFLVFLVFRRLRGPLKFIVSEKPEKPEKPAKPWKHSVFAKTLWGSLEQILSLLPKVNPKPLQNLRKPLKTIENHRKPMKTLKNAWFCNALLIAHWLRRRLFIAHTRPPPASRPPPPTCAHHTLHGCSLSRSLRTNRLVDEDGHGEFDFQYKYFDVTFDYLPLRQTKKTQGWASLGWASPGWRPQKSVNLAHLATWQSRQAAVK